MKAFIILSVLAAASASEIVAPVSPYAGIAGLPYAGLPYAGLPYAGLPYAGLPYAGLPYAAGYGPNFAASAAPVAAPILAAAPVIAPVSTSRVIAAPAIPQASQFQSQDEFGNLAYGYANINSAKHEAGNTYGGVTGSYSYTDSNGIVQTVNYIADGLGFRVQATNLPVAPVAELAQPVHDYTLPIAPVFDLVQPVHEYTLPIPVTDTAEVAAAKAEFQAAFDEAASREKRSVVVPAATAPLALPAALPYAGLGYAGLPYAAGLGYGGFGYGGLGYGGLGYGGLGYGGLGYGGLGYAGLPYAAPVAAAPLAAPAAVVASAPATRAAVKTIIQNNPGFATSYIVN